MDLLVHVFRLLLYLPHLGINLHLKCKYDNDIPISCQSSSLHHSADGDPGSEGGGEHPRPDLPRAIAARHVVALVGAVAVLVALVAVAEAGVDLVLKCGVIQGDPSG